MIGKEILSSASLIALVAASIYAWSRGAPETAYASSRVSGNVVDQSAGARTAKGTALRMVLASTGNAARYRVRERLVGHDFPNDAVGKTKNLTGAISIDSAGKVIRDASKFTLAAGSFVSDNDRRDGFVSNRLLAADEYPTITFVPTEFRGVTLPLPKSGSAPIEVTGDLTVRGVTRPTTWTGTIQFVNGGVSGNASTAFTFNDLQLEQPRVAVLLSVDDTIKLEIDFNLIPQR